MMLLAAVFRATENISLTSLTVLEIPPTETGNTHKTLFAPFRYIHTNCSCKAIVLLGKNGSSAAKASTEPVIIGFSAIQVFFFIVIVV